VWLHKFATAAGFQAPGFVPVRIASESGPATADEPDQLATAHKELPQMASPPGKLGGMIEIEVAGARIRVEPGVELATLSTVLSALRRFGASVDCITVRPQGGAVVLAAQPVDFRKSVPVGAGER
jgi:hypothetical protein